jgi:hypothetical protein
MPRIPGATKSLTTLVHSYLATGKVQPAAQAVFDRDLPHPLHISKERMASDVNVIQARMGRGQAPGPMPAAPVDEANMLAKVRAKL